MSPGFRSKINLRVHLSGQKLSEWLIFKEMVKYIVEYKKIPYEIIMNINSHTR